MSLQDKVQCACNVCANGFACFSSTQFFPCDPNGVLLIGNLSTCTGNNICFKEIVAHLKSPCIPPGTTSCDLPPILLPSTTTSTTHATTTTM